jgi:uncharacterized protein YjdB
VKRALASLPILLITHSACLETDIEENSPEANASLDGYESELTASQRITYRAHVQRSGWLTWVYDPSTAGTTGQSRRLEAIQIAPSGISQFGICYQAAVAGYGWQLPVCNGGTSGTTGESRSMQELAIWLSPYSATSCQIQYRTHIAQVGWQNWVSEGMNAGCPGCGIEAVEIRFVDRNCN